jgi:hypothetical protein
MGHRTKPFARGPQKGQRRVCYAKAGHKNARRISQGLMPKYQLKPVGGVKHERRSER